jgi:hypothetical protein
MEPLVMILVPGLIGGLVLAVLLAGRSQGTASTVVPRRLEAPSPALINIAHIKVEGVGGLGMVAAVVAVAIADPRIRLAMIMAAALGTGLALVLIAIRRSNGAMPSGGPGARSTLHLDDDPRRTPSVSPRSTGSSRIPFAGCCVERRAACRSAAFTAAANSFMLTVQ